MAYEVSDIAKKILAMTNTDCGDVVSNLKLQKMLYYMQGFHLACFGKPLFDEEIEAWMYGPVVPSVYEEYKQNGCSSIPIPECKPIHLTPKEENIFDQVYKAYGQFSAVKLMDMTHNEMPWKSTETGYGNIISKDKIKKFFSTKIKA